MKQLFVIFVLFGLSVTAQGSGIWGENTIGDASSDQDQLIQAELDDEIQAASGLKFTKTHKGAKLKAVPVEALTEEMAIAQLGSEMAAAEGKASQAIKSEKPTRTKKIKHKFAKLKSKKKLAHLKAQKTIVRNVKFI